ncbi:MAG: DNA/RNA nuclease SfsA [Bdellovibrionaceae bacterium]|nr:DNA/RNA nuclease SfsA [Pseudobdellovibrionaceae bacterium]
MNYRTKLDQGIFLKRYKRFFADIEWQGQILVAHVPNTGSLKGVNNPGCPCLFSHSENPERKLKQTLEMIQTPAGVWVGVNTSTPNIVVREALAAVLGKMIKVPPAWEHWGGFDSLHPEYKVNPETRLDFALSKKDSSKKHFIEVKNVTLLVGESVQFPDAETTRGQKHLSELMKLMEAGHTAEIIFTVQRSDGHSFSPADDIDPEYGRLLRLALQRGLRVSPFVVNLSEERALLSDRLLPIKI